MTFLEMLGDQWTKLRGGGNVTFSVKKITGSHTRRNFEDNDLIFFLDSQN